MRGKIWILTLILILLILPMVIAEELNFNISVEGVSNISIKINTTDSEVRKDVYGIVGNSSTRDVSLHDPLFQNQTKIKEICEHATIFDLIGEMPPEEFVVYVKSLGYDDESHITMIWTMCHEEYIKEHEAIWSIDRVGWGLTVEDFIYYLRYAINWLTGNEPNPPEQSKELGRILSDYFASHREVDELRKELAMMNIRITALEKTMENISSEAYCRGKIETMLQYNLSWVKCGEESVYYYRVDPTQFHGYQVIGIEPIKPTVKELTVPSPNITITDFKISELIPGGTANANVTIHNFGNASGSVKVSIDIPSTWTLIPNSANVTLKPGETRTIYFAIIIPEEAEGTFSITGFVVLSKISRINKTLNVTIEPELTPLIAQITGKMVHIASTVPPTINRLASKLAFLTSSAKEKVETKVFSVKQTLASTASWMGNSLSYSMYLSSERVKSFAGNVVELTRSVMLNLYRTIISLQNFLSSNLRLLGLLAAVKINKIFSILYPAITIGFYIISPFIAPIAALIAAPLIVDIAVEIRKRRIRKKPEMFFRKR